MSDFNDNYQREGKKGAFFGGCLCGCCLACLLPIILVILSAISCNAIISNSGADKFLTEKDKSNVLSEGDGDKKIAVINISGVIGHYTTSVFSENNPGDVGRIIKEIRQVSKNSDYAALIIDMNTPGGEVVAGDEVRKAIDALKIPVVTCMHSMGASGGYYIASGSDWIVANSMTLTGSIGVIMHSFQYNGLLDKIGVKPVVYRSGDFKDILSGTRDATPEEVKFLNDMIQEDFHHFCQVVSDGRKEYYPTAEDVANSTFGDGRPLSGQAAFDAHLIDQLGNMEDAIAKARELCGCLDAPVIKIGPKNAFESLFANVMAPRQAPKVQIDGLPATRTLPEGNRFFLLPEALQ